MYTGFSWAGKKGLPSRYYLVVKIQPFQKDRTGWSFFMLVAQFRTVSWMNEFWKTAISCMIIVEEFSSSPPIKTDWVECCIIMTSQIPTHHRHCHSLRSLSGDDGIMVITVDLIILLGGIINYEMATKLFAFFGWWGGGGLWLWLVGIIIIRVDILLGEWVEWRPLPPAMLLLLLLLNL